MSDHTLVMSAHDDPLPANQKADGSTAPMMVLQDQISRIRAEPTARALAAVHHHDDTVRRSRQKRMRRARLQL